MHTHTYRALASLRHRVAPACAPRGNAAERLLPRVFRERHSPCVAAISILNPKSACGRRRGPRRGVPGGGAGLGLKVDFSGAENVDKARRAQRARPGEGSGDASRLVHCAGRGPRQHPPAAVPLRPDGDAAGARSVLCGRAAGNVRGGQAEDGVPDQRRRLPDLKRPIRLHNHAVLCVTTRWAASHLLLPRVASAASWWHRQRIQIAWKRLRTAEGQPMEACLVEQACPRAVRDGYAC